MSRRLEYFLGIPRPVGNIAPLFLPNIVNSYHERPFVQLPHNNQVQMATIIPAGPIVVPLCLITLRVLLALRIVLPRTGQGE
ncbi:hypothetical protein BGZ96_000578, partial [Linnemannia gamsii]